MTTIARRRMIRFRNQLPPYLAVTGALFFAFVVTYLADRTHL